MNHLYGNFSETQIRDNARIMHSDIHKLLLFKDKNVNQQIFDNNEDFINYFSNLLRRISGFNELLFCPVEMVALLATLQSAFDMVNSESFNYQEYRRLILDAHGYVKSLFEESED
jgi:hypothetical protein